MERKPLKRKKTSQKLQLPFPGLNVHPITNEIAVSNTFIGVFNGVGVTVKDEECMKCIYSNGFFGKGSLSRSGPQILYKNKNVPEILRKRQLNQSLLMADNTGFSGVSNTSEMAIVLSDTDEEENQHQDTIVQDKYKNWSTYLKVNRHPVKETLLLTLEEAFFLSFTIGCLVIKDETEEILNLQQLWNLFRATQCDFVYKYVVYHYFRSKQWVVKSGLKYGSDFLLYKDGPPFYHASYIVIIEIYSNFNKVENEKTISLNRNKVSALTRLSITSGKEVLLAQVSLPDNFDNDLNKLSQVTVNEVFLKRIFLDEMMKKK